MGLHDLIHPLIILYRKTKQKKFPLVMFIGREPNSSSPYGNFVGEYDFDEASKCSFWNMSYKLIGGINGFSVSEFKNKCRRARSSPIIFSDSLPSPIPMKIINKSKIRLNLNEEKIRDHIGKIFNKEIIERVDVIFLSGLSSPEFSFTKSLIISECRSKNIDFEEVPFMYGSNFNKIKLSDQTREQVKLIFNEWMESEGI